VYTTFDVVADKETAFVGDTVTFTARLDGKPAIAKTWRWVPIDTSQHDGTTCAQVKTCAKVMVGSGTMKAYLVDPGSSDSAAKTVIVQPPQSATFTASASGASFTISRWSFEGRAPCGTNTQCTYAPPFTGTMWAFGTVRGVADSASAPIAVTLDANDSTSVGTDSTAILRVRTSVGLTATPSQGTYVYGKGATLPYAFAASAGYAEMATFLDDTLTSNSGSINMMRDRMFQVAADPDFNSCPHIAELRTRLRNLVNAANKPEAFRQHIAWVADTAWALFPTSAALDSSLRLAEYLEFDPVTDGAALIAFDQALSGQVFRITSSSSGPLFSRTSPSERSASLSRGKSPTSLSTDLYSVPDSIVFTFVNGIRTMEAGALNTRFLIEVLRTRAEDSIPNSRTEYYWNANLRGEILALTDPSLGCTGQGIRHLSFRQKLTAIVRIGACKALHIITIPVLDDIAQSAFEFANLHWSFIKDPTSDDLNNVKNLIQYYHANDASVVFIPHSQGNMIVSQAVRDLKNQGYALEEGHCTAILSLASPITKDLFFTDSTYLRGMTMDGDLLQVLAPIIGTYSNFMPRYPSTKSAEADASISSVPSILQPLWRVWWGVKLHDVDDNYVTDANNSPIMTQFMKQLNNACRPTP
jgi:hypothetical protein